MSAPSSRVCRGPFRPDTPTPGQGLEPGNNNARQGNEASAHPRYTCYPNRGVPAGTAVVGSRCQPVGNRHPPTRRTRWRGPGRSRRRSHSGAGCRVAKVLVDRLTRTTSEPPGCRSWDRIGASRALRSPGWATAKREPRTTSAPTPDWRRGMWRPTVQRRSAAGFARRAEPRSPFRTPALSATVDGGRRNGRSPLTVCGISGVGIRGDCGFSGGQEGGSLGIPGTAVGQPIH